MNYTSTPISHPLISLTACRNCGGVGTKIINGVMWRCFNCAGAGTVATYGPKAAQ